MGMFKKYILYMNQFIIKRYTGLFSLIMLDLFYYCTFFKSWLWKENLLNRLQIKTQGYNGPNSMLQFDWWMN